MASTESMPSGVVKFSCQYLETDPNSLKACLNHSINALSSANDHITDLTKQLQNATSDLKQCESDGQAITLFNDFLPLLILTCALLALVQIIRSWVADHRRLRNKQKVELENLKDERERHAAELAHDAEKEKRMAEQKR